MKSCMFILLSLMLSLFAQGSENQSINYGSGHAIIAESQELIITSTNNINPTENTAIRESINNIKLFMHTYSTVIPEVFENRELVRDTHLKLKNLDCPMDTLIEF